VHDDVDVPMPPAHLTRHRPRHPAVWILAGGTWRKGWISVMVHHRDQWLLWCQHDWEETDPWVRWAWYVYDEATIRRRDGSAPPGGRSAREMLLFRPLLLALLERPLTTPDVTSLELRPAV
jgi:hypothetical protein